MDRRRQRRVVLTITLVLLFGAALRPPLWIVSALSPHRSAVHERTDGMVSSVTTAAAPLDAPSGQEPGFEERDGSGGAHTGQAGAMSVLVEELRGGWRTQAGLEEAVALAVLAGHRWVATATAPGGATSGKGSIVVVEALERPGGPHGVVTLLVVHEDTTRRIAVPVGLGVDGPALAGTPWELPFAAPGVAALEARAIGDPTLMMAAREALERVGIPGERLVALEATESWPFIARLDDPAGGHPWLRWHLDRFVVTGLPLDRAGDGRNNRPPHGMGEENGRENR